LDYGQDATVRLNGVTCTISVPSPVDYKIGKQCSSIQTRIHDVSVLTQVLHGLQQTLSDETINEWYEHL